MKGRSEKTKQLTEVEQQVVTHHSIQIVSHMLSFLFFTDFKRDCSNSWFHPKA